MALDSIAINYDSLHEDFTGYLDKKPGLIEEALNLWHGGTKPKVCDPIVVWSLVPSLPLF